MTQLSHVDEHGRVRMVDTGNKEITSRRAVASARVLMTSETVSALREHRTPKGDPLETARLAGILAAKRTADLIPLCHSLPLSDIHVDLTLDDVLPGVRCEAIARTNAQTGVEMEAITAVAISLVTIYDMAKAIDRDMSIGDISLQEKSGGRSGSWKRRVEA